jgi:hypothetical protein
MRSAAAHGSAPPGRPTATTNLGWADSRSKSKLPRHKGMDRKRGRGFRGEPSIEAICLNLKRDHLVAKPAFSPAIDIVFDESVDSQELKLNNMHQLVKQKASPIRGWHCTRFGNQHAVIERDR